MDHVEKETPEWLKKQIEQSVGAKPIEPSAIKEMENSILDEGVMAEIPEESFISGEDRKPEAVRTPIADKSVGRSAIKPQGDESVATREDFLSLANELGNMLADKNRQYGDSYARMAHVLPMFYPDGVPPDQLLDAVFILRIVDKLMRIASAQGDDQEDPVLDLCGYGILRLREMRNGNN